MYQLKYIKTALTLAVIALAMVLTPVLNDIKPVFANSNTDKEEFQITVKNIEHKDLVVTLAINGKTQHFDIDGNKKSIDAPTVQIVKFKVARNLGETPPAVNPLKLGDEYTACVAEKDSPSQGACLRASVDSLTIPQSKTLDAKFIPG